MSNQSAADTETPVTLSHHECRNSSYGSGTMQNRHDIGGDDTNDMPIQHGNQADIVSSGKACGDLWFRGWKSELGKEGGQRRRIAEFGLSNFQWHVTLHRQTLTWRQRSAARSGRDTKSSTDSPGHRTTVRTTAPPM